MNNQKTPTSRFNYNLPEKLIAQKPTSPRDHARLMVMDRKAQKIEHKKFYELGNYLNKGDVIVLNDSKVIPARLLGVKETGGQAEIFLLTRVKANIWQCLVKGKTHIGTKVILSKKVSAEILDKQEEINIVKFNCSDKKLFELGQTPLPPYIKAKSDPKEYQTVYAKHLGSVAAPTAGLHFTPELIKKLKKQGIKFVHITLHVGMGTFAPVKSEYIEDHKMHPEFVTITSASAKILNEAKKSGARIVACGTTAVRTLEACTKKKELQVTNNFINIFIYPGYKFKFVDTIITNFHLPKSTLLMLISTFAGEDLIKRAYQEAIKKKYHFYSFGDAMLII